MKGSNRLNSPLEFSEILFERMIPINAAIKKLALYEFRYAIEPLYPGAGWDSIELDKEVEIERMIRQRDFYDFIETKPREKDRIVLDKSIARLTRMIFSGLVRGEYSQAWVNKLFYFDLRGFYFLPRTVYFTEAALAHFGGEPFRSFEPRQKQFENVQDIGYWDFQEANVEIDQALIESIQKLIGVRGTPILITLAGPTAAGKTEITERLLDTFEKMGKKTTTIEMDNFLLDRDFRDNKVMGKETTHFNLFKHSVLEILQGKKITIPRYDSLSASSSHDLEGNLRPGCLPLEIRPADIIFLEGNFPFQMEDISSLIGLKVVYLTDDPIRLKRKWKRDIDYRKNYDPAHFRNRFFKTQFQRAEDVYRPQIEKCDLVVDTTAAALWATPQMADLSARIEKRMSALNLIVRNIEAIFFDMNGTLRVREPHEPTQNRATQRILELLKKNDIPESYWDELTRRRKKYNQWAQEHLIQLAEDEIWTRWILPEYPPKQIRPVAAELTLAWGERNGCTVPKPGAEQMLVELKRRGYHLGIISNSMSSLDIPRDLDVFGWKEYFDIVILPSAIKFRKPAPEPFLEAARVLKVNPTRCAYLGNRISKDIVGCKRAGFGLGIILEPTDGPRAGEQDRVVSPEVIIHSLNELLEVFPMREPT